MDEWQNGAPPPARGCEAGTPGPCGRVLRTLGGAEQHTGWHIEGEGRRRGRVPVSQWRGRFHGGGAGGPSRYRVVVAARQSGSRHRAGQRATPPSQAHSASVARAAARYPFQGCYFGALTIGTLSGDPTRRPKPRRVPSDGSCQKVSRLPSSGIRIKDTEHRAPCDAVPCCDRVHSERSRILTKYRGSASLLLW